MAWVRPRAVASQSGSLSSSQTSSTVVVAMAQTAVGPPGAPVPGVLLFIAASISREARCR